MCCEPTGSTDPVVGECEECGGPVDSDGDSTNACYYSPTECEHCGWAPCDGSC